MPLGPQTQARIRSKDIICIHTMVGYLFSTEDMFDNEGFTGTESHFGVGGKWGSDVRGRNLDGAVWQFQDTDFTADANLEGKWTVISIETADNAPQDPDDLLPWTPKQVESIVDLIAELCLKYNIPPKLIPDTKDGRRGLAYHAQGCTPNVVAGGQHWSTKKGKVCPGPARIKQFKNTIIPRVQGKLKPTTPEDLMGMEWTEQIGLTKTDAAVWTAYSKATGGTEKFKEGQKVSVSSMLRYSTLDRKIYMQGLAIAEALRDLGVSVKDVDADIALVAEDIELLQKQHEEVVPPTEGK
jgi:N-acetylmuramoyl-L-alanine amidase-like protein